MIEDKNVLADISSSFSGRFGISKCVITPPLGIYSRNWGAAKLDQAIGIHQHLFVHCLIMESYLNEIAILVTADLGWWKNAQDARDLRNAVLKHFQLSESDLIIALSHTHAGPSICSSDRDLPGGNKIAPYLEFLKQSIIAAIQEAKDNLFRGTISWGYGVSDLACNRDQKMGEEYLIGFNPLEPADQTLLVGQLFNEDDNLQAILCNYACHPTTFAHENDLISPDYVGELRNTVEQKLAVPCIFLQGASGDLAPKKQYVRDPAIVEANGRALGYAVLATRELLPKANRNWVFEQAVVSGAPLGCWTSQDTPSNRNLCKTIARVSVPYKQLESAEDIKLAYETCEDRVLKDRLWRKYNTRIAIGNNKTAEIAVWLWKFGNVILVAQANEAYSIYQKQVRASFPNHCIVFINIANGYVGYLAPKELYNKDIYAVWQSPYAAGSLEQLIEESISGIAKLLQHEA